MPFANYSSFSECVAKNKNKGNPKAYCGAIQARVEGKSKKKTKNQAMLDKANRECPGGKIRSGGKGQGLGIGKGKGPVGRM